MQGLNARRALRAWEEGQRRDNQGRALALLSAALPAVNWDRLAELPLGQRDALLCRLRQLTFGHNVQGSARCPQCRSALVFPVDLRGFKVAESLKRPLPPEWLTFERYKVLFRLPNSRDMAFVAEYSLDVGSARDLLLDRLVLQAQHRNREIAPRELPETLIERLGERMEEVDPMAELPLAIGCARCGHKWQVLLDVGVLMWDEVAASSQRLLHDIHTLALAYGWTEEEILKLSASRRGFYISLVRPKSQGSKKKRT